MTPEQTAALLGVLKDELPEIVSFLKAMFHRKNPTLDKPKDEDVAAAVSEALASIKVDDDWLAAHPDKSDR